MVHIVNNVILKLHSEYTRIEVKINNFLGGMPPDPPTCSVLTHTALNLRVAFGNPLFQILDLPLAMVSHFSEHLTDLEDFQVM